MQADKFDGSRQPAWPSKEPEFLISGRELSVLSSSTIIVNPDIPEAYKLLWMVGFMGLNTGLFELGLGEELVLWFLQSACDLSATEGSVTKWSSSYISWRHYAV